MSVGEPVPEDEVLLTVAESEVLSRRWARGLSRCLRQAESERVRYSPRAEWSQNDRRAVVAAVRALPLPRFVGLGDLGVTWFEASLRPHQLPELRVPTTREFRGLAPDGRLTTLIASLDKGLDTPDAEFSGWYRRLKNAFVPSRMVGRPCLVGTASDGPGIVIEGVARLAVLLHRYGAGEPTPERLLIYLGLSERLEAWESFPPSSRSSTSSKAVGESVPPGATLSRD